MGENGVKWSFCRTHYRTQNWGLGVETSDMPFPATGCYSQNVNYAPLWTEKDTIIVQYYCMFLSDPLQ